MESKLLFKQISKAKNKLEQNYQHTNKTQCPNKDTLKKLQMFILLELLVFVFVTTYRR